MILIIAIMRGKCQITFLPRNYILCINEIGQFFFYLTYYIHTTSHNTKSKTHKMQPGELIYFLTRSSICRRIFIGRIYTDVVHVVCSLQSLCLEKCHPPETSITSSFQQM